MASRLESVRRAVERGKEIAGEFQSATMNIYEDGNTTPLWLDVPCRFKKPKPSSFDAGNQTEWATKSLSTIKAPMDLAPFTQHLPSPDRGDQVVRKGLIVQISTPDGDPTINGINFTVQSALTSQFAAEREIKVATEARKTPRIT